MIYYKELRCIFVLQPLLRQQAVNALTLWTDQTSLLPLVECEALMDTLKMENPNLRIEVYLTYFYIMIA